MNKRQKKKREKKRINILFDETSLLYMTPEEQNKAFEEYEKFKKRHEYKKKYKDLILGKTYVFIPKLVKKETTFLETVARRVRKHDRLQNIDMNVGEHNE